MKPYDEILCLLPSLLEKNTYDITMLANFSALLFEKLEQINWVGFYIHKDNKLLLGPFQRKIACTEIPFSKGVCGACATTGKSILVPNVHEFKGHIACDAKSNSEICIPLFVKGKLFAVLDIDSPILNRFSTIDEKNLEFAIQILSHELEKL